MSKPYTTEQFIQKAEKIHGKQYDYKRVAYRGSTKKIEIHCKIHGPFQQRPSGHLEGYGCPECGKRKIGDSYRKSKAQFIKDAKKVHGTRYSYEAVSYKNTGTPVIITCKIHGNFEQKPVSHLSGHGCPECGLAQRTGELRMTAGQFIEKANSVHDNKYSYENTEYINSKTQVEINCPEHGAFHQKPNSHLSGHGCPKCANVTRSEVNSKGISQFVDTARKVHGDRYSYEFAKYQSSDKQVTIRCKIHGIFLQRPVTHLEGKGCPKCGRKTVSDKLRHTTARFIENAKKIYGDWYTYEKSDYVDSKSPMKITCKVHGVFKKNAHEFLKGYGCPKCAKEEYRQRRAENFLQRAREIHKNRYQYKLEEYQGVTRKMTIICPIHGPFHQAPNSHLAGHGCRECALELARNGFYNVGVQSLTF